MVEGGRTRGLELPRLAGLPRLLVILTAWGLLIGAIQLYVH